MYDIIVGNEPTSPIPRRTAMDELYGRYHGRILVLAARSTEDGAWKAKLREILAEFDDDCRELSAADNQLLRYELADRARRVALFRSDEKGSSGHRSQAF